MKIINRITFLMIVALILSARVGSAEVVGGYVNSDQQEFIVVFFDAVSTQKILLGASLDSIKINEGAANRFGKLYIVQPDGRWAASAKAYKDKAGMTISVPRDEFDKVVYLGRDMKIRGAMGLSESEIAKMATLKKSPFLARTAELVRPDRQLDLFDGVDEAARGVLDGYDMSDDERGELFASTVGWTAGLVAQELVEGILKSAESNDELPADLFNGYEFDPADEAVIKGVGVVSEGDNGGGVGSVSEGDNGGGVGSVSEGDNGGGVGSVSEGDNGGGVGSVSEGDNGGGVGKGFVGVVVSGWDVDVKSVDLPNPKGMNANCAGTYLFLF